MDSVEDCPEAQRAARPAKPLLLLVDDDEDLRESASCLLAHAGFDVIEAIDGRSALAILQALSRLPDVVVSDVHMPHMDGLAFVRALRARERLASLPVVLWSSTPTDSGAVEDIRVVAKDGLAALLDAVDGARSRR